MKEEKQNEIETKEEVENTELVEVKKETLVQKGAKFVKKGLKKAAIVIGGITLLAIGETHGEKRGHKKGYDEGYNTGAKEMYEKYNNNNTLENVEYEVVNDDNNE